MRWVPLALVSFLFVHASVAAGAQTYPDRPIRLIVPIAAGSVTDVILRTATKDLASRLGQPIVIENKGGASGISGAQACASATPDGYTICAVYHNTMVFNPLLFDKLPYDPNSDIEPISLLFFLVEAVAVDPALKVNSIAELRALAHSTTKELNFGTLGAGSYPELFLKWLNNQWGAKIVGVPYRGGAPIAQALSASEIQIGNMGLGNFIGLAQSGRLKLLAVSGPERSVLAPDVPTFEEAGLQGYKGRGWWGLGAPKGTPRPILDRLNFEFVKLFREPAFKAFLAKQAVVAAPGSAEEFANFIKADKVTAETLIKIANTPRAEYSPDLK